MGILLFIWSGAACAWWIVSALAVRKFFGKSAKTAHAGGDSPPIVIFKPLPPGLSTGEREEVLAALDSFAVQLQAPDCMVVGVPAMEEESWEPVRQAFERRHSRGNIQWIARSSHSQQWANPKIDGLAGLAETVPQKDVLWLWSDVDIVAAPDFLARLRSDWNAGGAALVTCPFVIRRVAQSWHLLDALFVNADFFPGVCLLDGRPTVRFALGSAMLFRPEDFFARGGWAKVGMMLADDFALGNLLQPVRLGSAVLETHAAAGSWPQAVEHVYRWQKTVRWCRPWGFAGQIVLFPILGWMLAITVFQGGLEMLLGAVILLFCESVRSVIQLRLCGCPVRLSQLAWLPFCAVLRAVCWVACWLPIPVSWRNRFWTEPESLVALPAKK